MALPHAHKLLLQETNTVRVWNNGDGIPVEVHKEEGVYVPELIFGHLLTSSNYNDDERKARTLVLYTPVSGFRANSTPPLCPP